MNEGQADGPIDVVDLFSGCGGMSLGFLAVNSLLPAFRLVAASDIDDDANATYSRNLGLAPDKADVHALAANPDKSEFLHRITQSNSGRPLVLIGCAPCQGFSSHRNENGHADPRNQLFEDFVEVAEWLKPDVIVGENVPELLTTAYWPHVKRARSILQKLGYSVSISVHNMASFGVPQERFRTLLLATKRRPMSAPSGGLTRKDYRTVRDAIGGLPAVDAGELGSDRWHRSAAHRPSTIETIRRVPRDGGSRPSDVGPASLRAMALRQGKPGYEDVYGRLWWDRPAITITAYARNPASGRFSHPEQDRGLTIREASLLQGFPDGYEFVGTLDSCFRQIGNAVPPPFSANLALNILGHLVGAISNAPVQDLTEPVGPSFSRLIPSLKAQDDESGMQHVAARVAAIASAK